MVYMFYKNWREYLAQCDVEVGYLEPLQQLLLDEKWRLLNSGGGTNLVILVLVKKDPKSLVIEAWERSEPKPENQTCASYHPVSNHHPHY